LITSRGVAGIARNRNGIARNRNGASCHSERSEESAVLLGARSPIPHFAPNDNNLLPIPLRFRCDSARFRRSLRPPQHRNRLHRRDIASVDFDARSRVVKAIGLLTDRANYRECRTSYVFESIGSRRGTGRRSNRRSGWNHSAKLSSSAATTCHRSFPLPCKGSQLAPAGAPENSPAGTAG